MGLRTRRALALLASAMFVAAACGTGATETPAADRQHGTYDRADVGAADGEPHRHHQDQLQAHDADRCDRGATVVLAEWQSPDSINTYYGSAFTNNEAFYGTRSTASYATRTTWATSRISPRRSRRPPMVTSS